MRKMTHLLFKIPYIMPPRTARSASALSQTSKTLSIRMASSGVSDESDSELQFADKYEFDHDRQHSKAYYREPSSTVTNLKPQPGKKKRSKLVEARQEIEVMCSTTSTLPSLYLT